MSWSYLRSVCPRLASSQVDHRADSIQSRARGKGNPVYLSVQGGFVNPVVCSSKADLAYLAIRCRAGDGRRPGRKAEAVKYFGGRIGRIDSGDNPQPAAASWMPQGANRRQSALKRGPGTVAKSASAFLHRLSALRIGNRPPGRLSSSQYQGGKDDMFVSAGTDKGIERH